MSDLKKDLEEIEAFLLQPSPLGRFAREKTPEYLVLKAVVENTGRILARAQYVCNMRQVEHALATAKLKAFVNGEELDKDTVDNIECNIANFITEMKKGVWN